MNDPEFNIKVTIEPILEGLSRNSGIIIYITIIIIIIYDYTL